MTPPRPASPVPAVSAEEWAELRERVRRTRWSPEWPVEGWSAGTDQAELRRLARRWAEEFDWPAQERRMRALPWAQADLDGTPVAYLRFEAETFEAETFEAETPGRLPIVLTNGWPSTALELVALAERLASPSRFGGDPAEAATVVVPALPGFPFSPQRPGLDEQTHELWHRLMTEELGFARYAAHGGDLGAGITSRLAESHPEAVAGIHLLAVASPRHVEDDSLTAEEREHLEEQRTWFADEGAYEHQQQTRPLTLAPALSDSPIGLLAWILEKHRAWSDCGGDVSTRFDDDYLLTLASLYWFTDSISTSLRPYWEYATGRTARVGRVEVPTALAVFPFDLTRPPRSWAERSYDVVRYTPMPRGGHFAPHEEPDLLAADIRALLALVQ
ncbi:MULTISPECIES: epoxide hydrolase family protein [unclassified Rathayibacter]|uniref:epoxide hydrolase family protein n=1 Tax=unclassified Rathayibacter TaxID=2609250 RepID=UPI0010471F5A|nr:MULTISPECIES: epoxide hydrolase family protein [unclassified Rathayibacter]TCL77248.1 pimeloyl-ACP methyl ester carboxylesterase [Rathayibacter sp. PhB192]TCM23618.1 pimeloyl-ACP methyl ester carboxylesterase [Rathayibacter sp. PhB179]